MSSLEEFLYSMENWANTYFTRSLTGYFEFLKASGISMQQAYVLTYVYYNTSSKISDICEHMMVSAAAASQMVDRLEKMGYVKREAEPGDRRVRNVVLTSEGHSFVKRSVEARQSWVKEIPPELSDDQKDKITAALNWLTAIYIK